jgi:hypothetical protein
MQKTQDEWVALIKEDLKSSVTGIISAGQRLTEAKRGMDHGNWLPFLEKVGELASGQLSA